MTPAALFDPRDPPVQRRDLPSAEEIARAHQLCEQDRRVYVLEMGKTSPRAGLQAIVDTHEDAVAVMDQFLALCDEHGPQTMAKVFTRFLQEPRR